MAIVNHIEKYNLDATTQAFYMTAAVYLSYGLLLRRGHQSVHTPEYVDYSAGTTRHRECWKFTQDRLIKPSALSLRNVDDEDLDVYTFDIDEDDNFLISDFLILENACTMPSFDITSYDYSIIDILASSFVNMLKQRFKEAYMYLSFYNTLRSLLLETDMIDKTHTEQYDKASVDPLEL